MKDQIFTLIKKIILNLMILLILTPQLHLFAQEQVKPEELFELSLEDLMNTEVTLASGVEESLIDAPAAMIIITSDDIKQRGYTSLNEVLMDLPGFDISVTNGADYMTAYQRGYRTLYPVRTMWTTLPPELRDGLVLYVSALVNCSNNIKRVGNQA